MPRVARITAAGYPHHITQRDNYRQRHIPGSILEHIRGNYWELFRNYIQYCQLWHCERFVPSCPGIDGTT